MEIAIRSTRAPGSLELRSTEGGARTLFGHFSRFNVWYEVSSKREGHFLERVAPGAFTRAFRDHVAQIRVMFDHGQDPTVGQKPLGDIIDLEEDAIGARYGVDLFDATYVNDLVPAFKSPQTGASFRFSVADGGDEWDHNPRSSSWNIDRLPERTIHDVNLFEFGPVVWGASPTATSDVRSGTDDFFDRMLSDPLFLARFTERAGLKVVERILSASVDDEARTQSTDADPDQVAPEDTQNTEVTADGQAEDNRNRIAEALARFRHQTERTPDVDQ